MSSVDYEGFRVRRSDDLPDPPYVDGDHAAVCRGCPPCVEAEEAWRAEQRPRSKPNTPPSDARLVTKGAWSGGRQ